MRALVDQVLDIFKHSSANTLMILGPTASGKSALAVAVAKKIGGEVISADSRQVYKEMNVGTGKITPEEMSGIPHYMLDIVSPDEDFTTADFVDRAQLYRNEILQKKKVPIVVGGTGLYLSALLENFSFAGEHSEIIRDTLEQRLEKEGIDVLFAELESLDPISATQLGKGNPRYVLRALEAVLSGNKKSETTLSMDTLHEYCVTGLNIDTNVLNEKINRRHAEMFVDDAIIHETKYLLESGYSSDLESMTSIGYKECQIVLNGNMSKEEAITIVQTKARQYAKRQRTWFRRMEKRGIPIYWISPAAGL